jgi:hypothetical protein
MARTLRQVDDDLADVEKKLDRAMKLIRKLNRVAIPTPEENSKSGVASRVERVLVGGKVVVRAKKPR